MYKYSVKGGSTLSTSLYIYLTHLLLNSIFNTSNQSYVLSFTILNRYVDDVLIDAPSEITREMLASLNISLVVQV